MKFLLMIIAALIVCGCSSDETSNANANDDTAKKIHDNINSIRKDSGAKPKVYETDQNEIAVVETDPVEKILNSMTLEEKLGQMMIFGFHGTTTNADIEYMLQNYHTGGIILFDRNMENKAQVEKLTAALQVINPSKVPLFFAIDEEGGRVARMKENLTPPPSQEEIGNSDDPTLAYRYANSIAQELKAIGINLNFAPVADVGTKDTRSFSSDSNTVANFVTNAAAGYEDAGIFYCLKHFPGIGLGKVDSHEDISTIDASRETFDNEDLVPFKKIISERNNSKFMVMVSHYKYAAFDAENSATLSPAVITELLRNELGFKGVVITDDLNMGAVSKYHDEKSIAVAAVKAGVDVLLSCHEYEKQKATYEAILSAVKSGEISEERINDSVRRILTMKLELAGK